MSNRSSYQHTLLHLSLITGIGSATILKIARYFSADETKLSEIYCWKTVDFVDHCNLSVRIAQHVVQGLGDHTILQEELRLIAEHSISLSTIFDDNYPQELLHIYLPPPIVYRKGAELFADEKRLAIVGSRKAGSYAKRITEQLASDLVGRQWVIVSGGAVGIDTVAHCSALKAGGKTVVVLGSGLMQVYPRSNTVLFDDVVAQGGTLLSIFPLCMRPFKGNFPARNRVIAGLSKGCLLTAAAKRSGALITAHYALEQGKQVFAVPGSIFDELSHGCHNLIAQGAKLVTSVGDIFEEFGELVAGDIKANIRDIEAEKKEKQIISDPIVAMLEEPRSVDELLVHVDLRIEELQQRLFDLQLDGKVKQNFAGYWERC